MRRRLEKLLLFAATLIATYIAYACSGNVNHSDSSTQQQKHAEVSDFTSDAKIWSDSVVSAMDTTELIGQLIMPASYTSTDAATLNRVIRYIADDKLSGIVWLKGDTTSMKILTDTLTRHSRIPLFQAIDAEWGLAMRLEGATLIPRNPQLANASPEQLFDYGVLVASEARRLGINIILAPVLDVVSVEASAMRRRSYGSNPDTVARQGCAFASGIASQGVMPVAKHFPGLGATRTDTHKALPTLRRSRSELDSLDLLPFSHYISQDIGGIMTGHIYIPDLDSIKRPATLSPVVINGLLRTDMGFNGLIFTDAMNMRGMETDTSARPYVEALLAGADMLIVPIDTREAITEIRTAIADGSLPLEIIREKARRILFQKYRLLY